MLFDQQPVLHQLGFRDARDVVNESAQKGSAERDEVDYGKTTRDEHNLGGRI